MTTKQLLAILSILLLISHCDSWTQESVRFGIGGGMNFGRFALPNDTWPDDSARSQTPNKGVIVVAFLQARISDISYIVPQLAYVQRGTRVENVSFETYSNGQYAYVPRGSLEVDAEFIELSTRFMLKFGSDWIKACPYIAPLVGINLSSQSTYEYSTGSPPHAKMTIEENTSTPPIELGLDLGLTLEISPSEAVSYLVNFGYTVGLTDQGAIAGLPAHTLGSRDPQLTLAISFAP